MRRGIAVVAALAIAIVAIAPARRAALRSAGLLLTASDNPQPADFLVMDRESGTAGILMVSELYRAQPQASVGVFDTRPMKPDAELARRGVVLPDLTRDALVQLGVPAGAIVGIAAAEAGTTETAAALAEWARQQPDKRVLVVVGPSHGRRYRRALRRVWPDQRTAPLVVTTPHAAFQADDWWQSRTTAREGLVELQKLALDFVRHPW
jgi:uncharacterized SAM-binding protein YcdF (DUF218 family)